jgi:outer membrane murein-binding lipoprotein Lpp
MTLPPGGSVKPLPHRALRLLVSDLACKLEQLEQDLSELRTHHHGLQQEVEWLRLDNGNLRASSQALKDEIARLKNLPPRPPVELFGMEKVTQPRLTSLGQRLGRGAKGDQVTREVTIRA